MDESALKKLKVQELKDLLMARRLSVAGKKEELIQRLLEAGHDPLDADDDLESPGDVPALNNDLLDSDNANVTTSVSEATPEVLPGAADAERKLSYIPVSVEGLVSTKSKEGLTEAERIKQRAERFGVELTEAQKKAMRNARFGGGATSNQCNPIACVSVFNIACSEK